MDKAKVKKIALRGLLLIAGLLVLIQLVPYGCGHTNPPVTKEPAWSSPAVRSLAVRACYDCHSNATVWPWYAYVAPMKWLVQSDVDEGRQHLNFSEWDQHQRGVHKAAGEIESGEMPLWFYLPMHSDARLTADEKQQLITELRRLAAASDGDTGHGPAERNGDND